ncbi:MAG: cob(I)yrinic acid a,c-diamide adenosyltransferase [Kiritimatiellia bacterium]
MRIIVLTGEGKGKTTSAMGMVLRAVGHGQRVCIVQFIKKDCGSGEIRALGMLPGVEMHVCGKGFVFERQGERFKEHLHCAEDAVTLLQEKISPFFDMIVLDEICPAISLGLVSEETVLKLLDSAPDNINFVLTGRDAPPALIARADTVSRIECVKHGFNSGFPAAEGVEI